MRSSKYWARKHTHTELEVAAHNGNKEAQRLLDTCTCAKCKLRTQSFGKYIRDNLPAISGEPEF